MPSDRSAVKAYYDSFAQREWSRLLNPNDGVVEWLVNTHYISRYLPGVPSRILDIGGGPGRYAIWLAEQGHSVVLADVSQTVLDIGAVKVTEAGVRHLVQTQVADVTDLSSLSSQSFDAVLCMGPFYHLPDPADRSIAAKEVLRVLRPGGVAFVALMPIYSLVRRTLALSDETTSLEQEQWRSKLLQEGKYSNSIAGRFNEGYGVRPSEVITSFEAFGFKTLSLLSSESILIGMQAKLEEARRTSRVAFDAVLEIVLEAATDPSIHGLAAHLLYIANKVDQTEDE